MKNDPSITSNDSLKTGSLDWNKVVPDLLSVVLYYLLFDKLLAWQQQHLALSCTILMLLNILAVGSAAWYFFMAYRDENALKGFVSSLTKAEGAALGLSAFISSFAFCWWLVPFAAAKSMGVKETGFILGATAYFILYLAAVVSGINPSKEAVKKDNPYIKNLSPVIVSLFFFFSYTFLILTLQQWHPSFAAAKLLGVICLVLFYLPLRFFILIKPPVARIEYLFFLLSFFFMLYQLFVKV